MQPKVDINMPSTPLVHIIQRNIWNDFDQSLYAIKMKQNQGLRLCCLPDSEQLEYVYMYSSMQPNNKKEQIENEFLQQMEPMLES